MRLLLILWLALLTLSNSSAWALTIDQAVNDALRHNPQIQQFLAFEDAAGARADRSEAPFWPRIDTSYTYLRGERDPDLASRGLSTVEALAGYNLFNGGSDWFRLHEARYRASAANYQRRSVVADIVLETKEAYIEILRAKRNVETEGKSVELLERQRHDTQLRLEQGLIARNDLLRVEVEMATAQQRLALAEGRFEITRKVLAKALGRALDSKETISDFSLEPAPPGQEEELRQEMFAKRSELHYLRSLLAAQKSGRKAVQGDLMPDVDLVLSYDRFGNNGLPQTGDTDYDSESKAIVQASWTLFSGFDTSYELVERKHEIRARQEEIKSTEDQLTLQLQTALEAFRVSERNLATAVTAVTQAEENYRVNENRYQANVASTVDLLDAQEFLTRARNEKVKAQYDLFRSAAVIERVLERGPTLE
jgi:outer membrane protein TolC